MENSLQEIQKHLSLLPRAVRETVVSVDWHSRVKEISQKYSLSPAQTDALEYEVLFILVGMDSEDNLTANIEKQLSVSHLLAGQMSEEVITRVLRYLLDIIEKREKSAISIEAASPSIT